MDEIDISKGQSLGTFLVLFFLLDNGFFCKKKTRREIGIKELRVQKGILTMDQKVTHTKGAEVQYMYSSSRAADSYLLFLTIM